MWKASVGVPAKPQVMQDDDWDTDPDFVNNVTEQEQRWGSKTIEGSGRTAGAIDMAKLREETTKANDLAKEKQKAEQPNASYGYGGKFGVEKDRMDRSAVGHDYIGKVEKHVSQTDYNTGFGGKFGVQTDRVDKSAVSWSHKEKIEKHASQKDYSSGFGGKFGVERDRQDKSAVGWDYNEKSQKHDSQTVSKANSVEQSQKSSDLRAKFESLAQKKDEPPRPLGKPKSVAQRWPPVNNSSNNDTKESKRPEPVKVSTPAAFNVAATTPVPAPTPTPAQVSTPADSFARAPRTVEQTVVPAPAAFQTHRHSSEEEWDTGREDDRTSAEITPSTFPVHKREEPAPVQIPSVEPVKISEEKRVEPVVKQDAIVIDEDLADRVLREEMALREQLAQEMNADAYEQDLESNYTAIALYDYQAAADDEISFDPDEIISNIEMIDEGWWRGTCRGMTGLFPANYVQLQDN